MKVNINFKMGLVVSLVLLTISACGKGQTVTSTLPNGTYGSCGSIMPGNDLYTGDIVSCQDVGQCNPYETSMDGTLLLSIYATGGLVSGQATITASLTVNGSTFCCSSQGLSYVSMPNNLQAGAGAKYILNGVTLICQPTSGGYYQSSTLRIGTGVYAPYSMVTTDQRFVGDFQLVSGVNLGGNSNNLSFFAQ